MSIGYDTSFLFNHPLPTYLLPSLSAWNAQNSWVFRGLCPHLGIGFLFFDWLFGLFGLIAGFDDGYWRLL